MTSALSTSVGYPRRRYAFYVMAVLMVVAFLSQLDRQIPVYLVGPIRRSLRISDTQMSLLLGPSFAATYCLMGLPLGALVDRTDRRNIIAGGLLIWSVMTICCGLASGFWSLFAGRVGVGLGEAALLPASYSLLADYVEPRLRGRTLSVFFLAISMSSGASLMLIGGLLWLGARIAASAAILSHLQLWQLAFVLAGLPGVLAAPLLLSVREAPRRAIGGGVESARNAVSFGDFLRYAAERRRAFFCLYGAFALLQFSNMAGYAWAPTLFIRHFGVPQQQIGLMLGGTIGLAGTVGALLSFVLTDRWADRERLGGRFRIAAISCASATPLNLAWPLVHNHWLSLGLFGLSCVATALGYSSAAAIVQDVVPNRMRGKAMAVHMLVTGLAGYGLAPTAVAFFTDYVFHSDAALPYSLFICIAPASAAGAIASMLGFTSYCRLRRALREAETEALAAGGDAVETAVSDDRPIAGSALAR
jgi:MFS family permease